MSEFTHGYGPESGGFEDKPAGKSAKKKGGDVAMTGVSNPRRIERVGGDTSTPKLESAFRLRPLGGDAMKSSGLFERSAAAKPAETKQEPTDQAEPAPHANEPHDSGMQAVRAAELEQGWRPTSEHELAAMAAADAEDRQREREQEAEAPGKNTNKEAETKPVAHNESEPPSATPVRESELPPQTDMVDKLLAGEVSPEFTKAVSGEDLTNEAAPDLPPVASPAEMPPVEQFETALPETETETEIETETPPTTRLAEAQNLQEFARQRADVGSADAPLAPDAFASVEPRASNESDDEKFRGMIEHETGKDPGEVTLADIVPGYPPVQAGGGANRPPNYPPTARGGPGSGGGSNPNNNPHRWANPGKPNNNPNILNPNTLASPNMLPGILNPATAAGFAALGARERFRNARNLALIVGLFGGEALLAAGLAGEHFWNGHKRRQMRREYNKKFKQQSEALDTTNQNLHQEQLKRQKTQNQLENLSVEHAATSERLRHISEHRKQNHVPAAETAAGAGLISAAAAAELARRVEHRAIPPTSNLDERELAHSLKQNRELGRAIKRNPELRDALQPSQAVETVGDTVLPAAAVAGAVAPAEIKDAARPQQLRELVGASSYADTLRREHNFEHLQTEPADNAATHQAGGVDSSGGDMSGQQPLPRISDGTTSTYSTPQLSVPVSDQPSVRRTNIAKPAIAVAAVLLILGIVLIAVFG